MNGEGEERDRRGRGMVHIWRQERESRRWERRVWSGEKGVGTEGERR